MKSVGIFLAIFGVIVIIFPEIIAILIGFLLVFLGVYLILLERIFTKKSKSKESYVKFGKYKIFR